MSQPIRRADKERRSEAAKARSDLAAALDGLDLPEGCSACGLCGRTAKGKGSKRRREILVREMDGPPPPGWRLSKRRTYSVKADAVDGHDQPYRTSFNVTEVTLERTWRLCRDCVPAHALDDGPLASEWPVIAVLTCLGIERTAEHDRMLKWPVELVDDARRVVRELGSFAYRHAPGAVPADPGNARPWAHLAPGAIEQARAMLHEAAERRDFRDRYGEPPPVGSPGCYSCGVSHQREWAGVPVPEAYKWPPRPHPNDDLAACLPCAAARERSGHPLADWAVAEAAGAAAVVPGLARRLGFVLAYRHPSFGALEGYRAPWEYLGADREELSAYVRRIVQPEPEPDGRLKIPELTL